MLTSDDILRHLKRVKDPTVDPLRSLPAEALRASIAACERLAETRHQVHRRLGGPEQVGRYVVAACKALGADFADNELDSMEAMGEMDLPRVLTIHALYGTPIDGRTMIEAALADLRGGQAGWRAGAEAFLQAAADHRFTLLRFRRGVPPVGAVFTDLLYEKPVFLFDEEIADEEMEPDDVMAVRLMEIEGLVIPTDGFLVARAHWLAHARRTVTMDAKAAGLSRGAYVTANKHAVAARLLKPAIERRRWMHLDEMISRVSMAEEAIKKGPQRPRPATPPRPTALRPALLQQGKNNIYQPDNAPLPDWWTKG
ncbi:MAG: hypothetical protein ACFCVE_14765 [Phycisphaerae bacterium]